MLSIPEKSQSKSLISPQLQKEKEDKIIKDRSILYISIRGIKWNPKSILF